MRVREVWSAGTRCAGRHRWLKKRGISGGSMPCGGETGSADLTLSCRTAGRGVYLPVSRSTTRQVRLTRVTIAICNIGDDATVRTVLTIFVGKFQIICCKKKSFRGHIIFVVSPEKIHAMRRKNSHRREILPAIQHRAAQWGKKSKRG